ncbi:MAG: hypothetical protein IT320_20705 [Anaerolineae bacterium]|nr:hypothetical protein [Anaerolineae bacterium]
MTRWIPALLLLLSLGAFSLLVAAGVSAEGEGAAQLTAEQTTILDGLNTYRTTQSIYFAGGLEPLLPNATLNRVAQTFLSSLTERTVIENCNATVRGDPFLAQRNATLSDVLNREQYGGSDFRNTTDLVAMVWTGYSPDEVVNQWVFDQLDRRGQRRAQSLRISQGRTSLLPVFDERFNEVGIAYESRPFGCDLEGYFYTFVFGFRPQDEIGIIADLGVDLLRPIQATQTAAMGATQIAPFLPTIESALTATAAALPTSAP